MEIKKNTIPYQKKQINQINQIKELKSNESNMNTTFESKNSTSFMSIFSFNSKNNQKKEKSKKNDCKTPDKKALKKDKKKKTKERKCKTPLKHLENDLFEEKNLNNKENNLKKEENNLKTEKPKIETVNKKPILKRATKVYELNYYDPFTEIVNILDGEGKAYEVEFQRKDLEIKITFKDNVLSHKDIHFTSNYFSFPQYCICKVKYNPDTKVTTIILKDNRCFKIQTKDDSFFKKINFTPNDRIDFFKNAYLLFANQTDKSKYNINGWEIYNPMNEFNRQEVPYGMDGFRVSQKNSEYELCETYPRFLILPSHCDDLSMSKIASCRIKNRFPALTYVYTLPQKPNSSDVKIQAFLYRSSQINSGFFNCKNNYEVEYINAINNIDKYNKGFIFFDCRPYLNAKANSFKGAGVDDTNQYENCGGLIFGCIENIHAVRKSLKKAFEKTNFGNFSYKSGKLAFNTTSNNLKKFLSKFEESKWLEYLSDIICGANLIVDKLSSKINVFCHCSDGWDRTSQVCSLVQIILDPYYRTFEGFAVLIEKDWVSFGHQFAIRNGCDCRIEKKKERSPIFVQFIHVIYQIMAQYPNAFEFNENMLLYLTEEIYSNKFGTFLFNSEKELNDNNGKTITVSIWSEIFLNKKKFLNPFYTYIKEPLIIKGEVQYLIIWKEFFYKYIKIGLVKEKGEFEMNSIEHMENVKFNHRNSIIELLKIIKGSGLEKKMENNEYYKIYKDYLNS